MTNNKQIVDEKNGVMIRVDKTLEDMVNEKPFSRIDAKYWHKKYDQFENVLKKINWPIEYLDEKNQLEILTGFKGVQPKKSNSGSIYYITSKNFKNTGLNLIDNPFLIDLNSKANTQRTQIKLNDILLVRSGEGSLGYVEINSDPMLKANVRSEIYVIRIKHRINPYYLTLFLKSNFFGKQQMWRIENGVGTPNLNKAEISAIRIPMISKKIQSNIEKEYLKMNKFHKKAMEAKKNRSEKEYQKNIVIAEKMLNDLINKTEQVIRGERKDVV